MSDKHYLLSYYVKVCQTCLSRMSIIVILCQTCLTRVVAQDIEISLQNGGESLSVGSIELTPSSDIGDSPDIVSDNPGQTDPKLIINNDNGITNNQSDTDFSLGVEGLSVVESMSNLSGSMAGSGSSDTSGEVLIIEPTQTSIGRGVVEQNVPETPIPRGGDLLQLHIASFALMTSFVPVNPLPQLSITEVRIDGTDEYIEITNRGAPFSGSIAISGSKSSLLTVGLNLGTKESAVIGDTLAMVVSSGFDIMPGQGLSMTDTIARSVQLIYSGDVIDSLDLTTTQVFGSDNQSASREYDFIQQIWQVTPLSHNANIISGYRGNPGLVRGLTLFPPNTGSINTGSISTGSIFTGSIDTGIISTGTVTNGTIATGVITTGNINTGLIQISQVYPFTDCMGEHLVLSFSAPYSGSLTIAGLGTSDTSKTFDISAQSGSTWYVVESMSGVLSDNVILVPNITLTDGGESLVVSNGSGLIFDSVIYSSTQPNKASIFTLYSGDTRTFTTNQSPTILSSCNQSTQLPQIGGCRISAINESYTTGLFSAGFTVSGSLVDSTCESSSRLVDGIISTTNSCILGQSFAPGSHRVIYQQHSGSALICEDEYMFFGAIHQQTITNTNTIYLTGATTITPQHSCSIGTQNKTPFVAGNSVNLIAILDNVQLSNSSHYVCNRSGAAFSGSDDCNPTYFKLVQASLVPLSLIISNASGEVVCQTQSVLNYPSPGGGGSCSASDKLYYKSLYLSQKDQYNALKSQIIAQGRYIGSNNVVLDVKPNIINPSKELPTNYHGSGLLEITDIIFDPKSEGVDQESITIFNNQIAPQNLSGISIFINGKRAKSLSGIIYPGANQEIVGNFNFPNKGGCVTLANRAGIRDEVCYGSGNLVGEYDISDLTGNILTGSVKLKKSTDLYTATQCLHIEEYELLKLDMKEQKLINKMQKANYRTMINSAYETYRIRSDELYHRYRDITDKKQAYIESQKTYIIKLQGQIQKSYDYGTRITQLYNKSKDYNKTLSERNRQCQGDQQYVRQNYPAVYHDPQLNPATDTLIPTIIDQTSSQTIDDTTRRSTASDTISNLF